MLFCFILCNFSQTNSQRARNARIRKRFSLLLWLIMLAVAHTAGASIYRRRASQSTGLLKHISQS